MFRMLQGLGSNGAWSSWTKKAGLLLVKVLSPVWSLLPSRRSIISKVDINKDGVLAAASARKPDKGVYVLQERARVDRDSAVGVLDVEASCKSLLVHEDVPQGSVLALKRAPGSFNGWAPIRLMD